MILSGSVFLSGPICSSGKEVDRKMENNEIIAVPVGNNAHKISGIVRLNNSGREIVEMLGEEISIETIVDNLSKKYENKQETIIEYVNETLEALRRYDLIEE